MFPTPRTFRHSTQRNFLSNEPNKPIDLFLAKFKRKSSLTGDRVLALHLWASVFVLSLPNFSHILHSFLRKNLSTIFHPISFNLLHVAQVKNCLKFFPSKHSSARPAEIYQMIQASHSYMKFRLAVEIVCVCVRVCVCVCVACSCTRRTGADLSDFCPQAQTSSYEHLQFVTRSEQTQRRLSYYT